LSRVFPEIILALKMDPARSIYCLEFIVDTGVVNSSTKPFLREAACLISHRGYHLSLVANESIFTESSVNGIAYKDCASILGSAIKETVLLEVEVIIN
jgi:hypothetical protein